MNYTCYDKDAQGYSQFSSIMESFEGNTPAILRYFSVDLDSQLHIAK